MSLLLFWNNKTSSQTIEEIETFGASTNCQIVCVWSFVEFCDVLEIEIWINSNFIVWLGILFKFQRMFNLNDDYERRMSWNIQ